MRVDLYTDAGVLNGLATWGCVAVVDGVPIFEAKGKMRATLNDSTQAELQAAANGLHAAIRQGLIAEAVAVRVICDNARAVALIRGRASLMSNWSPTGNPISAKARRARVRHAAALAKIRALAIAGGVSLTARGVKGHQPATSTCPHAPHNRRADKLCREARA